MSFLVLTGLIVAVFVVPATGAEGDQLPDLVAQPVGEPDSTATYIDDSGSHLLLRFTSYIANTGTGPLEVTGVNPTLSPTSGSMSISGADLKQVITNTNGTKTEQPLPGAELKFEETDGHYHWHFQKAARYSLYKGTASQPGLTQDDFSGFASKVGFCFLDIEQGQAPANYNANDPDDALHSFPFAGTLGTKTFFHDATTHPLQPCLTGQDGTALHPWGATDKVDMGISVGWRDVYEKTLPFQYVDVSDAVPGYYWVKSEVDPDGLITESNESNAPVYSTKASVVPGYIAQPVNAGQISGIPSKPLTSTITLSSTKFPNPSGPAIGAVQYQITEQPEHGTLTQDPANAAKFLYTKEAGYNGPDTFKYVAKQAGSQFPLSPASASVTMQVGSGNGSTTVGINGAPSQLYTSAGIQLSALVVPDGDVTWRVDDVVGGNATIGTIDTHGFYRAPAKVPANGKVRITATSDDGTFDAVEVTIVARPVVTPKPDLPDPKPYTPPVTPPVGPKPPVTKAPATTLSQPTIGRVGRRLLVKYMPGKSGKLTVNVSRKGKRLATCKVKVQKGRSLTCRFTLRKSKVKKLSGSLTVYAKLTGSKGKTLATRRTTVSLKVTASSTRIGPLCILTLLKG